jgi:hypothetical protein
VQRRTTDPGAAQAGSCGEWVAALARARSAPARARRAQHVQQSMPRRRHAAGGGGGSCARRAQQLLSAALLAAAARGCVAALPGSVLAPQTPPPPPPLVFFGVGGVGGSGVAPFTTPGQLAAAAAMATVAAQPGSHPALVLAAGDNFYSNGLSGACARRARACATRASGASAAQRRGPEGTTIGTPLCAPLSRGAARCAAPRARLRPMRR